VKYQDLALGGSIPLDLGCIRVSPANALLNSGLDRDHTKDWLIVPILIVSNASRVLVGVRDVFIRQKSKCSKVREELRDEASEDHTLL
jgi:hypothetical protein